jgi:hypothetical protein
MLTKKLSEYDHQKMIFKWADAARIKYPCLAYMHCSLNGVRMARGQAVKAKMSGMKAGVPDIFLPFKTKDYSGLFIELKVGRNKPTEDQVKFLNYLTTQNFYCTVIYGAKDAVKCIESYILGKI